MAHGGKRAGAGRRKGSVNKCRRPIKEAAQKYTEDALKTLVSVMNDKEQPAAARVSAVKEILDRGYGKPTTVIGGDDENPVSVVTKIELVGFEG